MTSFNLAECDVTIVVGIGNKIRGGIVYCLFCVSFVTLCNTGQVRVLRGYKAKVEIIDT